MNSPHDSQGMSLIVKTVCGWVKGFILLYGIHIMLYGHLTPGGGFAGGVIAATAFVLIMLAEGEQAAVKTLSRKTASTWGNLGVLLFWLMAMLGVSVAGIFFINFRTTPESARLTLFSGGIIPYCDIGISLMVCGSLYLVAQILTPHGLSTDRGGKSEEDTA